MSSITKNNQLISDITQFDINNIIFDQPETYEKPFVNSVVNILTKNPDNTIGDLLFSVPETTTFGFKKSKNHHSVGFRIDDNTYSNLHSIIGFCKSHMDKVDPAFQHSLETMTSSIQSNPSKMIFIKTLRESMIYLEKNGSPVKVKEHDLLISHENRQLYLIKPVIQLKSITRNGDITYLNWVLYETDIKHIKPLVIRPSLLHPKKKQ